MSCSGSSTWTASKAVRQQFGTWYAGGLAPKAAGWLGSVCFRSLRGLDEVFGQSKFFTPLRSNNITGNLVEL